MMNLTNCIVNQMAGVTASVNFIDHSTYHAANLEPALGIMHEGIKRKRKPTV